jgi:phosphate transport system substrate-binding protein
MTDAASNIWKAGYSTNVSWPAVRTGVAETGNSGMVTGVHTTPYSIAYIGISYFHEIKADKLGEAALKNRAGKFVLPSAKTIVAAASAMVPKTPKSETLSLVYAPGASAYPIINYEYAIIAVNQPNARTAGNIKNFLDWALTAGNASVFVNKVGFQPLPAFVRKMSQAQVKKVR